MKLKNTSTERVTGMQLEQCKGSVELSNSRARWVNKTEDLFLRDGYLIPCNPTLKNCWSGSRSYWSHQESCAALAGIFSMFHLSRYCRIPTMANSSCQVHILASESYQSSISEIYLASLKMEAHWLQLPIELDVAETL